MRALAAVTVLALVAACQAPSPEMTEADIAQIEAEVTELAEAWVNAWNDVETDCETAIDHWHPDHMLYFSGGNRVDRAGWPESPGTGSASRRENPASGTRTHRYVRHQYPHAV